MSSGHTYCAIGALTFLDRLSKNHKPIALLSAKAGPFESLVRWLVARQTSELGDDEEESDEEDGHGIDEVKPLSATVEEPSLDAKVDRLPVVPPETEDSLRWAGFNGRCNKYADTCYSFWNTASLNICYTLTSGWYRSHFKGNRALKVSIQHFVQVIAQFDIYIPYPGGRRQKRDDG
ncbi:hypothetical protein APSETT445_001355 [Aspergillus pseudonomiae]